MTAKTALKPVLRYRRERERGTGANRPFSASLEYLRLPYIREQYETLAKEAAEHGWSHIESLERLIEGEAHLRVSLITEIEAFSPFFDHTA